jgi:hypothetical protein
MLGPLVGGALTQYATWRWCKYIEVHPCCIDIYLNQGFYINLPAGAVVVSFLFVIYIPKVKRKEPFSSNLRSALKSLDIVGFLLFAPAAIMFLIALEWGGNQHRWDSATIIGLFCGAGGVFAIFLGWEYKAGDVAMIPFGMMKRQITTSSSISMFFLAANLMTTSYYMAIYFQAVRGVSPLMAGVSMLPSILSQMMTSVLTGVLGSYLHKQSSQSLLTVRSGSYWLLLTIYYRRNYPIIRRYRFAEHIFPNHINLHMDRIPNYYWPGPRDWPTSGTLVLVSFSGSPSSLLTCLKPIVAMQNSVKPSEIPVAMSLIVFFQNLGSSLFLSFDQTAFSNGLINALPGFAPGIDVEAVIQAGASGYRAVVPPALLPGVIRAYSQAVSHVFYLATGAAVAAFFACWGMGWKSVKKPKVVAPEA